MKKNEIRDLTFTSVLAAIIIVMTFVPQVGYISLGITELTLIHIPVLIGVFLLPKKYAFLLGIVFGLGSLLKALQINTGLAIAFINPLVSILPRLLFILAAVYILKGFKAIDGKFKHSDVYIFGLVSLVTILGIFYSSEAIVDFTGWNKTALNLVALFLIGIFITLYYAFISSDQKKKILIPSILLVSSVAHTVLVLASILIFSKGILIDVFQTEQVVGILLTIAVTNGLLEALLAAIIGTPIIIALEQVKQKV